MRTGIIGSGKVRGDDPEAKGRVSSLIEKIGFAPIDAGSLAEGGRRQRPGEARELVGEPR